MDTFKTIFSGQLEFGTVRSYEQVQKMFEHRTENYYRNDIILTAEEIFDPETRSLNVPRFLSEATVKSWRNTINLLEYTSEFAIAGQFYAWRTSNGKMLESKLVEPRGDKTAIQAYLKGRNLVDEAGKENEAKKALSRAIEKFERHALAYERRGYVNFRLQNYKDSAYDFSKSIDINPNNADPYYGRARVSLALGQTAEAVPDLAMTIKRSIPHQPLFWIARRLKGDCQLELGLYEEASKEYRFFTARNFEENDPNYSMRASTWHNYGRTLLELKKYPEAVVAFNQSADIDEKEGSKIAADRLLFRGMARQKAGEKGFEKDWKAAAGMGSEKAAELLEAAGV
ncbi:MAG: tetratricopeptide repeat protein [Saprospiraceae bacterium]|nr:tetratricopeptide repeat protein [Saprospiraceae bacterium]